MRSPCQRTDRSTSRSRCRCPLTRHQAITGSVQAGGYVVTASGQSALGQQLHGAANPGAEKNITVLAARTGLPWLLMVAIAAAALLLGLLGRGVWTFVARPAP